MSTGGENLESKATSIFGSHRSSYHHANTFERCQIIAAMISQYFFQNFLTKWLIVPASHVILLRNGKRAFLKLIRDWQVCDA